MIAHVKIGHNKTLRVGYIAMAARRCSDFWSHYWLGLHTVNLFQIHFHMGNRCWIMADLHDSTRAY